MQIAEFVNAREIQILFKENGFKISHQRACEIKKKLISNHKDVVLPSKYVIPKIWVLETYSDSAYVNKKKPKSKNTVSEESEYD